MNENRWGFWATLLWSAAILILFAVAQAAFIAAYLFATGTPPTDVAALRDALAPLHNNGDIISIATLLGAAAGVPAIVGVMKLKRGARLRDYLPLHAPSPRAAAIWLAVTVVWIVASDLTSYFIDEPIVPEFMRKAYDTASSKTLLWIAIVVAAPLFEETLFRGLLLAGLVRSKIGVAGAIVVSAFIWAVIHGQYDLYGRLAILFFGVILGAARLHTGTMLVPLLLHAFANTVATLEVLLLPGGS